MTMLDETRDLLPAYCAGSLPEEMHARVEAAIVRSPELLAEATELSIVNDHLLEIRRAIDAEAAS
ncbi:MAG: zf-HC2 domain-containing protein [Actinomycetota bacterium]